MKSVVVIPELYYAIYHDDDWDGSGENVLAVFTSVEKAKSYLDILYPPPTKAKKWQWVELNNNDIFMIRNVSGYLQSLEIRRVIIDPEPDI